MEWSNPVIGRVAYSRAGRDKGRLFIVIGVVDEDFVLISDGDLRPVEKPKKKRIKHLKYTDLMAEDIVEILRNGKTPLNADIQKAIGRIRNLLQAI
ncbi:MAG: RNA-binding protein [Clostridiaceae bacterium]|nr:RNA-binding protein [Clostridiaceae bacterium]